MSDDPEEVEDLTDATKREGGSGRPKVPETGETAPEQTHLTRGALVGRYVVLDILGEGGMGVVYSCFDPDLDRRVAIKLLQATEGESTGQAWLLREAQALARLAHPNVVAVHDVGTVADRVFVAMELVPGDTLRGWMRKPRTWRAVVAVMLEAATGLAAAHAAGLVHRDFKPENVIVGDDGRVRVMDFGLARLRGGDEPPASRDSDLRIESRSPLSESLTVAGTVVGTPAYMAPEIFGGQAADARGDQFAFGVALYESLFLARPYSREDLKSGTARPRQPQSSDVPARIRHIVMRAISMAPGERYPTMDALLAELRVDPAQNQRRVVFGLGAAAVVGGAIVTTYALRGSPAVEQSSELCTGGAKRLASVWDAAAKATVKTAFDHTKLAMADKSFAALATAIDGYARSWTEVTTENCEATRMRGEQTEEVMTLRQGCLDQRLEELRALIGVLGDPSRALIEKGERVVFELEPLARCSNVAALREPGMPPPEVRPKLAELTRQLAEAKAQIIAGRYIPALVTSQKAAEAARTVGWAPILSEALGVRGSGLMVTGQFADAAKAFAEATWAGFEGRRDDLITAGAFSSAMVVASGLGKPAEAKIWLELADSAGRRTGTDRQQDLRRSQVRGIVFAESGDLLGAVAAHEQTFKIATLLYGKDSPGLFADEIMYATTLEKAFRFKTAIPHFEHAIKLRRSSVGNEHPDIAMMESNLGISYRRVRDEKHAHDALEHALAIREQSYGKNSPLLVATLDNLGDLYEQERAYDKAIAIFERAQHLAEIIPGKDHPTWHQIATDHAEALYAAGRYKDARALLDEILAIEDRSHSVVLPVTQASRAELAVLEKAWPDAENFAKLAIAGFEAAGGPNNPELVRTLTALGRAQLELAKPEAKATLARALAIAATTELDDADLATTRAAMKRLE